MSKLMTLVVVVFGLFFANTAQAKGLTLFSCEFQQGGKVTSVRDAHEITVTVISPLKEKTVIVTPLLEAGVSTMISTDDTKVDSLDILQGDLQYSLMFYHGKLVNDARVMVFDNNEFSVTYPCKMDTVKNNLADPASIAGIFQP